MFGGIAMVFFIPTLVVSLAVHPDGASLFWCEQTCVRRLDLRVMRVSVLWHWTDAQNSKVSLTSAFYGTRAKLNLFLWPCLTQQMVSRAGGSGRNWVRPGPGKFCSG